MAQSKELGEVRLAPTLVKSLGQLSADKLKKILGTPAGSPWDTREDNEGSTGRYARDFLLFAS